MVNTLCPNCASNSQSGFISSNQPPPTPACQTCGGSQTIPHEVAQFIQDKFYNDGNGCLVYHKDVSPNHSMRHEFTLSLDANTWQERTFENSIRSLSDNLPQNRTTIDLIQEISKW